jgi:hypothetical protein
VLDQWNCLLPDVSVSPLPSLVYTIQVDLRLVFSVEVVVIVMVLNRANPTIFTLPAGAAALAFAFAIFFLSYLTYCSTGVTNLW